MDNVNIEEQIRSIISYVTEREVSLEQLENKPFYETYGMDSFEIIAILSEIEENYNITIEDENLNIKMFDDIDNLVDYIREKCNAL